MNRGSGLRIGKILGIPIYLHSTWIFIFAAFTTSSPCSSRSSIPPGSVTQHWAVGVLTSLLFFCSVVFHELSHSVVAQHYKIRVLSITLFLFGGLARIERDPSKAIQEFNIAIAGPLASGFLAACFFGLTKLFPYSQTVGAMATWLWQTNALLAVFNLLPGFPLDGGRIFRAIVWGVTKRFREATRAAGTSGKAHRLRLDRRRCLGSLSRLRSIWALDRFHRLVPSERRPGKRRAGSHPRQLARPQRRRRDEPRSPTVDGHITLEDYGAEVLRTGRRCHIVLMGDRLSGLMNVHSLNSVPREEWAHNSVQSAMIPRDKILWTSPEEPLLRLLERLLTTDINQMPVVSSSGENTANLPRRWHGHARFHSPRSTNPHRARPLACRNK